MYRLQFLNNQFKGKRLNIQQAILTIGRSPESNVNLDDDDEVSREHAVIEYRGGSPVIRDMGSINPVEVNGMKIKEHRLRHGDRIEVGRTVIEFISGNKQASLERKHRFSKLQAISFISIGAIVLLQVLFVLLFPLWQHQKMVKLPPIPEPEPEPEPVEIVYEAEELSVDDESAVTEEVVEPVEAEATELTEPAVAEEADEEKAVSAVEPEEVAEAVIEEPEEPEELPEPEAPQVTEFEKRFKEAENLVKPAAEDPIDLIDPLVLKAEGMLGDATAAIEKGELGQADNILERMIMIAPDYLPAQQARAELYEQRGMLKAAEAQWEEVMKRSEGTALHDKASEERKRLANEMKPKVTPVAPTKPVVEAGPPRAPAANMKLRRYKSTRNLEKRIRIHSVERERFQANEEFDEMRMARITLRPIKKEGAIDSSEVKVVVHFYDRLVGSSRVMLTRALVPKDAIGFNGEWAAGESQRTSATFILKKGFRKKEIEEIGEKRTYEGFRVSLYYKGKLQDEYAMPRKLLQLPIPPKPAVR